MKFNKGTCRVHHLGRHKSIHHDRIGADPLARRSAEKDLGVLWTTN